MNILVVHQNFPGQFPHIVSALLARGDKVAAIGGPTATARPGVDLRRWKLSRGTTKGIFEPATRAEADLIRADAAAQVAEQLRHDGFNPDVIIGHPGWGETLHLKLVWPDAKLILVGEYWYRGVGGDADFDPEFAKPGFAQRARVNAKNATQAMAYVQADRIISPTTFQASTFPASLRRRIEVAHEGVDLDRTHPRDGGKAGVKLLNGRELSRTTPYITYISRTLEPLRGLHIFMRALPEFLSACPGADVVIIGEDQRAGYGVRSPNNAGWRQVMLDELGDRLDLTRVHFLGRMTHDAWIAACAGGAAHVYYTYPFTLSWSLVEAMACEALVLGSDTEPVRDAITDGVNGRLLPFFDIGALSAALTEAVRDGSRLAPLRKAAREKALREFGKEAGSKAWLTQLDALRSQ